MQERQGKAIFVVKAIEQPAQDFLLGGPEAITSCKFLKGNGLIVWVMCDCSWREDFVDGM